MLFDGVAGLYGAGAADEITEELVRRLADTDAGRTLLRSVIGAAGEGTEEVVSDLLSPLAEAMIRDESVSELYRRLDPADLLYDYLIGFAVGSFGAGVNVATGRNAEANAELKARDANEAEYLRRMEEIGYLPAESNKNAARDGTAEDVRENRAPQKSNNLQRHEKSGIVNRRFASGALDFDSKEAESHAEMYYESVRHMKTDIKRIAKNTGISEQDISIIKQFLFEEQHDLEENGIRRFFADYDIAQSWQRLIDGRSIQPHDLTLLRHELLERQLMLEGKSQREAHEEASEVYNYAKELKAYHDKTKKHKKG